MLNLRKGFFKLSFSHFYTKPYQKIIYLIQTFLLSSEEKVEESLGGGAFRTKSREGYTLGLEVPPEATSPNLATPEQGRRGVCHHTGQTTGKTGQERKGERPGHQQVGKFSLQTRRLVLSSSDTTSEATLRVSDLVGLHNG